VTRPFVKDFFAAYPRAFNLHAWLVQEGFSMPRESTDARDTAGVPLAEARALEYSQRLATLDLTQTRAFATTCEGNYGSIRLNRSGREPDGPVGEADAEALIEALRARLVQASADESGRPCVVDVVRGHELYPGPHSDIVPDLIVETRPDVLVVASAHAPVHARHERPFPDHARLGILVLAGPSITPAHDRSDASIFDLAPTALHLLEQPVYREMHGRVLDELLAVERPANVLSEADDPALDAHRTNRASPYSPEELEQLTERLQSLGYTE
jgi:predicted AlkP superfamily phosphohydrolase/phosphomutase